MIEREPVERHTTQLIEDGRARQEALSKVDGILAGVRGTAHDRNGTVEVTVDGRGKLVNLWLAQEAARYGPDGLARLIVKVTAVAMDDATQTGYNKVARLLGDNLTFALEQLSGRAAPARRQDDGGITAEEFQARRDRRVEGPAADRTELDTFDPSSLRSDR
ncbi:YbaB/EbfC family nucleoid-associated protein [Actinophytocola oryzae]|uniref:YbaB/EbfC DNA-binding family protein n=1 Tax=Actinophytocola oryzae TaxID=502181 RepID=A0A4R7UY89_9PSEU|nr:YbaB/EbfC family nucleoid-associated protein [Actinophytocola oryzae]TDV41490.1 YbaB/EbfC DNA-binding family protein [Actinophytocola oryzae]